MVSNLNQNTIEMFKQFTYSVKHIIIALLLGIFLYFLVFLN